MICTPKSAESEHWMQYKWRKNNNVEWSSSIVVIYYTYKFVCLLILYELLLGYKARAVFFWRFSNEINRYKLFEWKALFGIVSKNREFFFMNYCIFRHVKLARSIRKWTTSHYQCFLFANNSCSSYFAVPSIVIIFNLQYMNKFSSSWFSLYFTRITC